jgi:amino acid transporter
MSAETSATEASAAGAATVSGISASRLSGKLGVGSIVFMVIAAAAPLSVLGSAAPLGIMLGNGVGFPSMFIIAAVILLLFSVGLSTMSQYLAKPGAFFTYVGQGLGRPLGLTAAWLAMISYTAMEVAILAFLGSTLSTTVQELGGPNITWWLYTLAMVIVIGLLGYRHIELSSKVLGVLLIAEIAIVLVMSFSIVFHGGANGLSAAPFNPHNAVSGAPGLGLMFAISGFIGFEATAIFRDEAREPKRTIPRATYLAVIIIGLFYSFTSWALVMAWGPTGAVTEATKHTGTMVLDTAQRYIGTVGLGILNTLLLTSIFACCMSFHNIITRYQHAMAMTSVLPAGLGRVHPKHGSPHISSLVQSLTAGILTLIFGLLHMDPIVQVLSWFAGVSTLGVVILMALTCVAVIVYFRKVTLRHGTWRTVVAPILGLIGLAISVVLIIGNFTTLIGGSLTLSLVLIAVTVILPLFGLVQARRIKRKTPEVYDGLIDNISI